MTYLSDKQDFGRPKTAHRLRIEALKPGEWLHILETEAKPSSVTRICSRMGQATGCIYHTRRTLTGTKVWRLS